MGKADQRIVEGRHTVVPRTLCFIVSAGRVLLLRGASDKALWPNLYNGVGGHVEPREDVFTAALREIREETGVRVDHLQLRGVINIPSAVEGIGVMLFVFTASASSREAQPSREGAVEWIAIDEVQQLDLVEDLPELLPFVLSMDEGDAPFFAYYEYDEHDQLQIRFADQERLPSAPLPCGPD